MQNINQFISQNFMQNIEYFQEEHTDLYNKLAAFDSAVKNGHIKEKYELVFENNSFDVYEKLTKKFLYSKASQTHTENVVKSINNLNDINVFEGFTRHSVSEKDQQDDYLSRILPITNYISKNSLQNKNLKKIEKFIFFGVGLGLHLKAIAQTIQSKVYFIIEDDLELFRLSLFTLNYKKISQNAKLYFSIFEDTTDFMQISENFLNYHYEYNHYLKYFYLPTMQKDILDQFQIALTSQPHIRFRFNNMLKQYLQPINYIFGGYKFLDKNSILHSNELQDMPFILLASGPSLEKNISWLQQNHQNFITIAVSSSISFLKKYNISPNIIIHIDPFEVGITSFLKTGDRNFFKDSLYFFSTSTPTNIVSYINDKERIYFFETGTTYKINSLKPSSSCVGSLAYQLLLLFKIKNIYLLGLDLSVDPQTGVTHAGNHQDNKILTKKIGEANEIIYKENLFNVAGNFKKYVQTSPAYYSSIEAINYFAPLIKSDTQMVYNLSDGAQISASEALNITQIKQKHHKNISSTLLKNILDKNSSTLISIEEKKIIKKKISYATNLQQSVIHLSSNNFHSSQEYIASLKALLHEEDTLEHELIKILDAYFKYMFSYLHDFFNREEIENEKEHLNNLQQILNEQISEIIGYYILSLQGDSDARD